MKLGDKVKVVNINFGDCNGHKLNEIGSIVEIDEDPTEYLTVRILFEGGSKGIWFREYNLIFVDNTCTGNKTQ